MSVVAFYKPKVTHMKQSIPSEPPTLPGSGVAANDEHLGVPSMGEEKKQEGVTWCDGGIRGVELLLESFQTLHASGVPGGECRVARGAAVSEVHSHIPFRFPCPCPLRRRGG